MIALQRFPQHSVAAQPSPVRAASLNTSRQISVQESVGGRIPIHTADHALPHRVFAVLEEVRLSRVFVPDCASLHAPEIGARNAQALGTITQELGNR